MALVDAPTHPRNWSKTNQIRPKSKRGFAVSTRALSWCCPAPIRIRSTRHENSCFPNAAPNAASPGYQRLDPTRQRTNLTRRRYVGRTGTDQPPGFSARVAARDHSSGGRPVGQLADSPSGQHTADGTRSFNRRYAATGFLRSESSGLIGHCRRVGCRQRFVVDTTRPKNCRSRVLTEWQR